MGTPKEHAPVKLFFGILAVSEELITDVQNELTREFGAIDSESPVWEFTQTDYYCEEMGAHILRKFISFEQLIPSLSLVDIKLFSNALELKLSGGAKRSVNLDPGYITLGNVVLATTKDQQHRIYMGNGIYFENTLRYSRAEGFKPWEWTYRDYQTGHYIDYFNALRERYHSQLRAE